MRSFRLHLRTARSSKAAQTVLRLSIVWLRHHSFELSVIRISHNPGVKTVCFLTSVFTSLHQQNLMRKHPCSYDDDDRTPFTGLHSQLTVSAILCYVSRRAGWNLSVCVQLYYVASVGARLICCYTVTALPPCGTEAVIFVIASGVLLPPAYGFFFFFFFWALAKCCVDNCASPRFFFLFFFTRLRGYSTSGDDIFSLPNI